MNQENQLSQGVLVPARRTELVSMPTQNPQSHSNAPGMVIDQTAVLAAVRRRWLVALVLGLLGGLIASATTYMIMPVTYTAKAEIRVRNHVYNPGQGGKADPSNERLDTYKQTLSRTIAGPLVLKQAVRRDEVSRLKTITEGDAILYFEENLKVANPAAEFIGISLTGKHKEDLAPILNAIVDTFITEVGQKDSIDKGKAIQQLDRSRNDINSKLKELMVTKGRLVRRLGGEKDAVMQQQLSREQLYTDIRKNLISVKIERTKINAELALREKQGDAVLEDLDDRLIALEIDRRKEVIAAEYRLQVERENLARRESTGTATSIEEQKKRVEDAETKTKEIRESLKGVVKAEMQNRLALESTMSTNTLKRRVSVIAEEIEALEGQLVREDDARSSTVAMQLDLEDVDKQIEQTRLLLNRLQDEWERMRITMGSAGRVEKFKDAIPPIRPDMAKQILATIAAGGGVFAVVVVGILFLDLRTRRISNLDDIVSGLRLPVIGSVPLIPSSRNGQSNKESESGKQRWQGALIESIDSARVMLLRRASLENAKVTMVTSAVTSEGKTTMSCHLATSLARAGYRTVVIDADLRRPTVHRVFEVAATPGLCEVLGEGVSPAAVIQPSAQPGLFVIAAGKLTGDVLRQLAQDGLNGLMEHLRAEFDFVIVDTSPLLPVTDGLLVAQSVDGVIVSIRRDVSQLPKVASAMHKLQMMGVPVWGAVAIGVDQSAYGYRYTYGYGYGYGYGAKVTNPEATEQPKPEGAIN